MRRRLGAETFLGAGTFLSPSSSPTRNPWRMGCQLSCDSRARRRTRATITPPSPSIAADQYERRRVSPFLTEHRVERAAGEHADQYRQQSPHDAARGRTGCSIRS